MVSRVGSELVFSKEGGLALFHWNRLVLAGYGSVRIWIGFAGFGSVSLQIWIGSLRMLDFGSGCWFFFGFRIQVQAFIRRLTYISTYRGKECNQERKDFVNILLSY